MHKHLRRKGRRHRKRGSAKDSRGIIVGRVDISMRPKIVDLEIDTIIGQNHQGAILTINERKSGFVWIKKLNGKDAMELAEATINTLKPNNHWLQTITSDNGKEFAEHHKIATDLNLGFYFAKPYHLWECGSNENLNGLIRQYIPKSSSFKNISDEDIFRIQYKLNNRPQKRLGFFAYPQYCQLNTNFRRCHK